MCVGVWGGGTGVVRKEGEDIPSPGYGNGYGFGGESGHGHAVF